MNTIFPIDEIWRFRELLRRLVVRNLKVRYQRSTLGFAWTLLNPLFTIVILVTVFGYIVRLEVPHYWAFLVSGYFAWVFVLHTLGNAAYIIPEHASVAKNVPVPGDLFVLGAVASRVIEFAAELLLVVVVLAVFHHHAVPASFVLLPVLVVLLVMLTLGLAMPAAALSVFFRDVQHALPVALTMLVYVSPVFYPATMVPKALAPLYLLNPLAGILTLFHTVLYEGRFPSIEHLGLVTLVSFLIYAAGYLTFRRCRDLFAEIV